MAVETWREGTRAAVTITLNSLANNGSAIGSALDGGGDLYARFELVLATGSNMGATGTVELYFIQQTDGSTDEDGSTTGPVLPERPAWVFQTRAATSLRRITPPIPIPPDSFKPMVVQRSGQALSGSGNSLAWQPLTPQVA